MTDFKIINETPVSAVELKEKLEAIKKRDKEIGTKATKTIEYLNTFVSVKPKEAENIKKNIMNLNISRLKERHIAKIVDLMPKDVESLKMLFVGENLTLKQEDLNKIFEAIQK